MIEYTIQNFTEEEALVKWSWPSLTQENYKPYDCTIETKALDLNDPITSTRSYFRVSSNTIAISRYLRSLHDAKITMTFVKYRFLFFRHKWLVEGINFVVPDKEAPESQSNIFFMVEVKNGESSISYP